MTFISPVLDGVANLFWKHITYNKIGVNKDYLEREVHVKYIEFEHESEGRISEKDKSLEVRF
jgi:hypothetical protein